MNTQAIIENKPYLTKHELAVLLERDGKNLDKKIQKLLDTEELISLKRGVYVSRIYLLKDRKRYGEFIANMLYYPSYLSLEYVLAKNGLIPENVYVYTSITNKVTREFENRLGTFRYRSIKNDLYTGFSEERFEKEYTIKIATKAKALFDWLYLKSFENSIARELKEDLRLNWDQFEESDLEEFQRYVEKARKPKMRHILTVIGEMVG